MSSIDEAIRANSDHVAQFRSGTLTAAPARKLAVLTCMDARLDVESMLGLQPGDAHIVRNAGGIVTEDAVRSIILSQHLLGTRDVMVINHTDCGMLTFHDEDLERDLIRKTGKVAVVPARFHSFTDLEGNVRKQVYKLRAHPWISAESIRGFIYDVKTGRLHEVRVEEIARAA
jgi:carbonic anhydrase